MFSSVKRVTFLLCALVLMSATSYAGVIFETNFNSVQTWNPAAYDACWQTTPIEGGSNSCTQKPWSGTWISSAQNMWNDYRVTAPNCSSIYPSHIGSASDIAAVQSGANFTPYGGTGKSYVHFYEPCYSASGGWGSDGLLGIYFGKTTGYQELYIQMKFKVQPGWKWQNGAQQKLLHVTHFDETYNSGVLQAYHFFSPDNMPTIDPGIYYNTNYSSVPGFYLVSYNYGGGTIGGDSVGYPSSSVNVFDGNWHTFQFHVKLNTAASAANGVAEIWIDAEPTTTPTLKYTNIGYTGSGTPTTSAFGFNRVLIGGNTNNIFGSSGTQWFAVDNLVISTTSIPLNYTGAAIATPTNLTIK